MSADVVAPSGAIHASGMAETTKHVIEQLAPLIAALTVIAIVMSL